MTAPSSAFLLRPPRIYIQVSAQQAEPWSSGSPSLCCSAIDAAEVNMPQYTATEGTRPALPPPSPVAEQNPIDLRPERTSGRENSSDEKADDEADEETAPRQFPAEGWPAAIQWNQWQLCSWLWLWLWRTDNRNDSQYLNNSLLSLSRHAEDFIIDHPATHHRLPLH